MPIHADLLAILRCPESRAPLVLDGGFLVSTDPRTRRRYRVEDDIPNMLVEESEALDETAWSEVMRRHGIDPAPRP